VKILKHPKADTEANTASKWDKFWLWLKSSHKSAVQAGLMQMCSTTGSSSLSGGTGIKSGITCNSCGGLGHYAQNCPSKLRTSLGTTVKVNVAVVKVKTRNDYNQHLPTKRQAGNCPGCNQPAHNYSRQFPFGMAEWPSTRLDTCPRFTAMTPRERGGTSREVEGLLPLYGLAAPGRFLFHTK